jgi:hypothetical protein
MAYVATVDPRTILDALSKLVEPGDDESDVERACIVIVDALVPSELRPEWDAAAAPVVESAGRRLARLVMALLRPTPAATSRKLHPVAERVLADAAKARARAAELASLPSVSVEDQG